MTQGLHGCGFLDHSLRRPLEDVRVDSLPVDLLELGHPYVLCCFLVVWNFTFIRH